MKNKNAKMLLLMSLIGVIPIIILSAWIDSMLTGARSFMGYLGICLWEYLLVVFGMNIGYCLFNKY